MKEDLSFCGTVFLLPLSFMPCLHRNAISAHTGSVQTFTFLADITVCCLVVRIVGDVLIRKLSRGEIMVHSFVFCLLLQSSWTVIVMARRGAYYAVQDNEVLNEFMN